MVSLLEQLQEYFSSPKAGKEVRLEPLVDYYVNLGLQKPLTTDRQPDKSALAKRVKLNIPCEGFDTYVEFRVQDIEQIIALLIVNNSINPDNLAGDVVDFGTGTGAGAYVLKHYGATIKAVDVPRRGLETALEQGLLTPDQIVEGDGFEYLATLPDQSRNFIAAFMMPRGFPHRHLYHQAQRILKTGGQLLITGGKLELQGELKTVLGSYGKIESLTTIRGDKTLGSVAFTYTKTTSESSNLP